MSNSLNNWSQTSLRLLGLGLIKAPIGHRIFAGKNYIFYRNAFSSRWLYQLKKLPHLTIGNPARHCRETMHPQRVRILISKMLLETPFIILFQICIICMRFEKLYHGIQRISLVWHSAEQIHNFKMYIRSSPCLLNALLEKCILHRYTKKAGGIWIQTNIQLKSLEQHR